MEKLNTKELIEFYENTLKARLERNDARLERFNPLAITNTPYSIAVARSFASIPLYLTIYQSEAFTRKLLISDKTGYEIGEIATNQYFEKDSIKLISDDNIDFKVNDKEKFNTVEVILGNALVPRFKKVDFLKSLKVVAGDFLVSAEDIRDLSDIEAVGGRVSYMNDTCTLPELLELRNDQRRILR